MYAKTAVLTILAWFLGLLLDANIPFEPRGVLSLRLLFPMITLGLCLLRELNDKPES